MKLYGLGHATSAFGIVADIHDIMLYDTTLCYHTLCYHMTYHIVSCCTRSYYIISCVFWPDKRVCDHKLWTYYFFLQLLTRFSWYHFRMRYKFTVFKLSPFSGAIYCKMFPYTSGLYMGVAATWMWQPIMRYDIVSCDTKHNKRNQN